MAYVYWIRHISHTNMFSEGYIGVTSKTPEERFAEHRAIARQPKNRNKYTLHKALVKYPVDEILVQTLIQCDIDYAYDMELKLRPERATGWNTSVGGYAGLYKGRKGFKQSPEWVEWIRELNSNPTPETRQRKREGQKRRYQNKDETGWSDSFEYLKKLRVEWETDQSPWRNPKVPFDSVMRLYAKADEVYEFVTSRDFKVTIDTVQAKFNVVGKYRKTVQRLIGMMWSGWKPLEDAGWLEDFRDGFFSSNGFLKSKGNTPDRRKRADEKSLARYHTWLEEQRKEPNGT